MTEIPENQLKDGTYYWAKWMSNRSDPAFIVVCDSAYHGQFSMCGCDEIIHLGEIKVLEEIKSYD